MQVLSIRTAGEPVAFAQLAHPGRQAEITEVYVDARHRGAGLGTALTRAAIESGGDIDDLWICADDEDRAKELALAGADFELVSHTDQGSQYASEDYTQQLGSSE